MQRAEYSVYPEKHRSAEMVQHSGSGGLAQPRAQPHDRHLERRLGLCFAKFYVAVKLEQHFQRALELRAIERRRLVRPASDGRRIESEGGHVDARALLLACQRELARDHEAPIVGCDVAAEQRLGWLA